MSTLLLVHASHLASNRNLFCITPFIDLALRPMLDKTGLLNATRFVTGTSRDAIQADSCLLYEEADKNVVLIPLLLHNSY